MGVGVYSLKNSKQTTIKNGRTTAANAGQRTSTAPHAPGSAWQPPGSRTLLIDTS